MKYGPPAKAGAQSGRPFLADVPLVQSIVPNWAPAFAGERRLIGVGTRA